MIERSITGVFDINFLKECETPLFYGPNSLGFKLSFKRSETVYLKISKIPEGFSLIKSKDLLRKICSFRSELVIPFFDICLLEKPFCFLGQNFSLVTLHPYKEIKPIGYFEQHSSSYQKLINYWILKGFYDLHKAGIYHGDVNIQNIGLTTIFSKTIPMLYNLNIYQRISNSKKEIFISPEFMAPEVFESNTYDLKSELWAIGVLLFTIYTKEFPFGLRSESANVNNIFLNMTQSNIDKVVEKSPQSIKNVVKGLLKLNPTERLSMDECINLFKKESNWLFRLLIN